MSEIRNGELNSVTREAVLAAIAECDKLGMQAFLEKHGYRPSIKYQLRHQGKSYPSKAILGVAAGLKPSEFFGGAEHVVRHYTRLGFQVREGKRVVTSLGLLNLARASAAEAKATWTLPELPVDPTNYFASGSNRTGEIRGLASVGQDIGVAAPEIIGRQPSEDALLELAGSDIQLFCDSGAFTAFTRGRTITPELWDEIFALYGRLGAELHESVFVVAPDVIGDQTKTIELLAQYRDRIASVAATGARILVGVQKGALSQAEFAKKIDAVLEGIAWVPALPCRAMATTPAELAAFVAARDPRHVHLLGLGPTNPKIREYLSPLAGTRTSVSLDASWISANVGKANDGTNGQSRRPIRRYTLAQKIAKRVLAVAEEAIATLKKAWRELALILSFGITSVLCMEGGED